MVLQATTAGIVDTALWAGVVVAVLVLALLAVILFLQAFHAARAARHRRIRDRWRPLILSSLCGNTESVPPVDQRNAVPVIRLWSHYRKSIRGKSANELDDLARRAGFVEIARGLLDNRNIRLQLLAIETLGTLSDRGSWDRLNDLMSSSDPYLSMAAAQALLRIDSRKAIRRVMRQAGNRTDWIPDAIMGMLEESGPEVVSSALPDAIREASDELRPTVLQYLKTAERERVYPALTVALEIQPDDPEVLAACLQVIGDVAIPEGLGLVRQNSDHERWFVRLRACSALARIGTADDVPAVISRLSDSEYWIRYRAAEGLADMPSVSETRLLEIKETLADRYGRDMLTQVIAEKRAQGTRADDAEEALSREGVA